MMSTGFGCRLALALVVVFITVFTPAPAYTPKPPRYTLKPRPTKPPVCLRIPPIARYRHILSPREKSALKAELREFMMSWEQSTHYKSRSYFKFASHDKPRCKGGRCRKGKRDTADKAHSRQKRLVKPCRKDYRQLSKKQMKKFHDALQELKGSGFYDFLVEIHNPANSPGAHFGAAFLPWHREYLYQLEQAMRALGKRYKKVTIPFWDSCMDQSLPEPRDCVVWWTDQFWGPAIGEVDYGELASNWPVTAGCTNINPILIRDASGNPGQLLTRDKIANDILPSTSFSELALASPFESYHGQKHVYVGGHLSNLPCAPNDPVFFLLHSMIDCIWDEWNKAGNPNIYPPNGTPGIGGPQHYATAPMLPFPGLQNQHGFWNGYTCCGKRPSLIQCSLDKHCKSKQGLLFCHQCQCHCKVREGGNCSGLPHNACYCPGNQTPQCSGNTCQCN